MCSNLFQRWFGGSKGDDGAARAAAEAAAAAQAQAKQLAEQAMRQPADSDAARGAADQRLRRLLAMRGSGAALLGGSMPAPTSMAKQLLGS